MKKNKIQKPVTPNCALLAENLECINSTMAFLIECPGVGMPIDTSKKYTVRVEKEVKDETTTDKRFRPSLTWYMSDWELIEVDMFESKEKAVEYAQIMKQTYPDYRITQSDTTCCGHGYYESLTEQQTYNKLLKFYGIDPKALEQERREILKTISNTG